MGRTRIDLTGRVFGRLTVIRFSSNRHGAGYWDCLCECGEVCVARGSHLTAGNVASCGCFQREGLRARSITHGMSGNSEYSVWRSLRNRCMNSQNAAYESYGGRGISVCPEWSSFEQFYADMGPRPSKDHSIERIDNNGDYCKENCTWATKKEQNNNRRCCSRVVFNGESMTIPEWSDKIGVSACAIRQRLRAGWSVELTLTTPLVERSMRNCKRRNKLKQETSND